MENIKAVITLMTQSAVKEHKEDEFLLFAENFKLRLFSKVLLNEIALSEAVGLRSYITEHERRIKNDLQRV